MAIQTLQEKFQHELQDIYDAEHQLLVGLQEMMAAASNPNVKAMLNNHFQQTQGHVRNLEQIFNMLGLPAQREMCDGVKGILSEGKKMIKETQGKPEICDIAILGGADKGEHYEISSYRGLIQGAQLMGKSQIVNLLQQNLAQEEQTAQLIEQTLPTLLQNASNTESGRSAGGIVSQSNYNQSTS